MSCAACVLWCIHILSEIERNSTSLGKPSSIWNNTLKPELMIIYLRIFVMVFLLMLFCSSPSQRMRSTETWILTPVNGPTVYLHTFSESKPAAPNVVVDHKYCKYFEFTLKLPFIQVVPCH